VKNAVRALLIDTPLLPGARRDPDAAGEEGAGDPSVDPADPCPTDSVLEIAACPMCAGEQRTIVNEFNKLIVLDWLPDDAAARYDHAVCHACGVLYASKRPSGPRYHWLFERFELAIGRGPKTDIGNLLASTGEVTAEERQELQRRASRGVFVSDHLGLSREEYLPMLLADRLLVSAHAEILGSLLDLRGSRVLEVRSRVGSLGAILQRLYDSDVSTLAFFERQRVVIENVYGLPARSVIDFDDFSIPYDGQFDLIMANHMITHAVRPRDFLAAIRTRVRPGGHVYFYNEPDDAEYLAADGQSMIRRLNPFHLQAFDGPSLTRALAANGFEVMFLYRYEGEFVCLCRVADAVDWPPMSARQRERRIAAHQRARDAAVLMLPAHARRRFAEEWDAIADRAFAAGTAEIGEDGAVRVRRRLRPRSGAVD
jgi:SAM-dependent methyltransferase